MSLFIPARVIVRVLDHWVPDGDCHISTYSVMNNGYAQIGWTEDGQRFHQLCHRVSWIAQRGPIPDDMTIDHICRRRQCINVEHLRLVTNVENATDNGQGRKTHCPANHPYSDRNTYRDGEGHRRCRACAGQKGMP